MARNAKTAACTVANILRIVVLTLSALVICSASAWSWGNDGHRTIGMIADLIKGTKPADLPVEQPTSVEFFLNLRTAKVLGLELPLSLLIRADELIESIIATHALRLLRRMSPLLCRFSAAGNDDLIICSGG